MNTDDPENNQIIPAGSSPISPRSRSLVLRGLKDLKLLHKSGSVPTTITNAEKHVDGKSKSPKQPKDLTSLVGDPVIADILVGIGEEYFNNGMKDKSKWHAALYRESEDITKGLGDVLEPLFPDIWEAVTGGTDYIGGVKGIYGKQADTPHGFKPDYGLRRLQDGVSPNFNFHFYNFRLYSIKVLGPGQFTTMVGMPYAGKLHALSLDFNRAQLDKILSKATPETRKSIEDQLALDPGSQRAIHLKDYICFGVRARLGNLEKAPKEFYVPLIVQEIFDT